MELLIDPLEQQTASATEQVFEALYQAVISVQLPPGTKVSEADVAKQLGVSRQPVRDAFFRLSDLGFLSIRPQRATLITQISLRAVQNAVFTRTALEVECLRHAMANASATLIAELQDNLDHQKKAAPSDQAAFHLLDDQFHEIICDAAGHPHVWSLIKSQKAHLDRIRYLSLSTARRQDVIAEHCAVVTAVAEENVSSAERLLRKHIGDVTNAIPPIMAQHPAYFDSGATS